MNVGVRACVPLSWVGIVLMDNEAGMLTREIKFRKGLDEQNLMFQDKGPLESLKKHWK